MPNLRHYFANRELTKKALDRYRQFAIERDWQVGGQYGKLKLYRFGQQAFDKTASLSAAQSAFRQAYEVVRAWPGVQRGGSLAASDDVFKVIQTDGGNLVGGDSINLLNLEYPSAVSKALEALLLGLSIVKSTKRYPWMPVSKILHFCNPGLFPIWDWEVVWYQVMWRNNQAHVNAPFRSEYEAFYRSYRFNPTTNEPIFLLYYLLWASSYVESADKEFGHWFSNWMDRYYRADLINNHIDQTISPLHATAFEFVAIGAAYVEAAK